MTDDPDDDVEARLAKLAETQQDYQRLVARVVPLGVAALTALAVFNLTFLLVEARRDPWFWRNLVAIAGLTGLGLTPWWGCWQTFKVVVARDRQLLESYRHQAEALKTLQEVRPVMEAIEDARARGVPLVIHPVEPYGKTLPTDPGDQTVH